MVSEIRIYVEGGGDQATGKKKFREGMGNFFSSLRQKARDKRIRWSIVACGGRQSAYEDYCQALVDHTEAVNILLVDSEDPVTKPTCSEHLTDRDGWNMSSINDDYVHLMVHVMENWLIADVDTLAAYYRNGFNRGAIPSTTDVETITKPNVERALENATQRTQKGQYHKIRHGPDILGQVSEALVRSKADHCEALFDRIEKLINPPSSTT